MTVPKLGTIARPDTGQLLPEIPQSTPEDF